MVSALPRTQSPDRLFNQFQSDLQKAIGPVFNCPLLYGTALTGVVLAIGANTIPHKLNRTLQGWFPIRMRAATSLYDSQDTNPDPTQTLVLNSSAVVTVDLWVF